MNEKELESPKRFQTFAGRLLAAKEIAELVVTMEVAGFVKDIARYIGYIGQKPGVGLLRYIHENAEIRSSLTEAMYDRYLIRNNLLTPEHELQIYAEGHDEQLRSSLEDITRQ